MFSCYILKTFVLVIVVIKFGFADRCSSYQSNEKKLFIDFATGDEHEQYSTSAESSFNFTTSLRKSNTSVEFPGIFAFVNRFRKKDKWIKAWVWREAWLWREAWIWGKVNIWKPKYKMEEKWIKPWHQMEGDHTNKKKKGYFMLVDGKEDGGHVFSSKVESLSPGVYYEFSAYIANVMKKNRQLVDTPTKPIIIFQVIDATSNVTINNRTIGPICESNNVKFKKYGLVFKANAPSILLLMTLNSNGSLGNDFAIDNIGLFECSNSSAISDSGEPQETGDPCPNTEMIGSDCDIPNTLCYVMEPCENDGICEEGEDEFNSYTCICPPGFNGTDCEIDERDCRPDTCLHGNCNSTSNGTSSNCTCDTGWEGTHCERRINYCFNQPCQNNGVCRSVPDGYECNCLGDSYSGLNCEIASTKIVILGKVSKSLAFISIIAITVVVAFFITMDALKYIFGIDPAYKDLLRIRQMNEIKTRKHLVIIRPVYINAPESQSV